MITDFLAFDDAVKVALDFAKKDGDTLVIAFPDHNTGGMKIGQYYADVSYTATTVDDLIGPFTGMQVSVGYIASHLDDYGDDLAVAIEELWGIDVSAEDLDEIEGLAPEVGLSYAIARVISRNHTVIGWTTHGHNGEDVPVWTYPQTATLGVIDNTDLPSLGQAGDLDEMTEQLYVDVDDAIPGGWTLDKSDPENYVLVLYDELEMPISKDYAICDGKVRDLGSLVVYAPLRDIELNVLEDRVFISEKAIDLASRCVMRKRRDAETDD